MRDGRRPNLDGERPRKLPQDETTTDFMIRVMEEFGEKTEPQAMLILYTAADGSLRERSNIPSDSMKLGMMEIAKRMILSTLTVVVDGEQE